MHAAVKNFLDLELFEPIDDLWWGEWFSASSSNGVVWPRCEFDDIEDGVEVLHGFGPLESLRRYACVPTRRTMG